ncbi:MAG: hypothetical protein ACO4AA_03390, partial [Aquiluna sp.]
HERLSRSQRKNLLPQGEPHSRPEQVVKLLTPKKLRKNFAIWVASSAGRWYDELNAHQSRKRNDERTPSWVTEQ